jgi:hypothetical protein
VSRLLGRWGSSFSGAGAPPQRRGSSSAARRVEASEASAARRSGGERGGAEASAAEQRRARRRRARVREGERCARLSVGERKGRQAVLVLSVEASWRIPKRCAMHKLTVAHHLVVRHTSPGILKKHARCSVDNNTHTVQWLDCFV